MMDFVFDIQMFANPNTQTTEHSSAGNDLSPEMKTYYNTELIEMAQPNLVHAQFGIKRPIPANGGKKIEWRQFSPFKKAVKPLAEGVTPDGSKLNVNKIDQEVYQYGDYTTISDILELTAIDNVILETTDLHGQNAGKTLDTVCKNYLIAGTNVRYAPKADGTVISHRYALDKTCKLTPDLVAKVQADLKAVDAPKIDGDYVCIIHPYVTYDLMRNPEWVKASEYAGSKQVFEGEVGKLYGTRFVESSEAAILKAPGLTAEAANLTVKSNVSASATVAVKEAITEAEATALVGRKVLIGTTQFVIEAATAAVAGSASIKLTESVTCSTNDTIYPGEAGKDNLAVFPCLFLGKGAYGNIDITGGGMEVIVKQKGSAGSADPLNQRSTIGWKALYAAKILIPEYIERVEVCSEYSDSAEDNCEHLWV